METTLHLKNVGVVYVGGWGWGGVDGGCGAGGVRVGGGEGARLI